jgi:outer membrane protein assembly factor BamB
MQSPVSPRLLSLVLLTLTGLVCAAPVGWRTDGTGRYPTATPPTEWAKDKNIRWATALPSKGNSTPILVGDRLFLTCEPATLVCVRASDGALLWQKTNTFEDLAPAEADAMRQAREQVGKLMAELQPIERDLHQVTRALKEKPEDAALKEQKSALEAKRTVVRDQLTPLERTWYAMPRTHADNGFASTTPTSDGTHIFVVFGTGIVACYDLTGTRLWMKHIEKPSHEWGHSASPLLVGGKLIVHFQKLHALNPATGERLWTTDTPWAWGTAVATRIAETDLLFTPAGSVVQVSDGKLLARNLARLEYNAPIIHDGVIYYVQFNNQPSTIGKAYRLPTTLTEPLTFQPLWETKPKAERYYASPVYHDGLLYAINQRSIFSAIDATTGAVVYEQALNLGGTAYPSICLAGGVLFVSSDNGATVVVQPGRTFTQIALNRLEAFRGSPIFDGKTLYLHGYTKLYAIGQ